VSPRPHSYAPGRAADPPGRKVAAANRCIPCYQRVSEDLVGHFRDSIELEKAKIEAKTGLGHTPYCILGLLSAVKRTIIHILKLSYLKIAFFISVRYDSYAGEVFLHFVQSIFSKIFTLPALKKFFPAKKNPQTKKLSTFFPQIKTK